MRREYCLDKERVKEVIEQQIHHVCDTEIKYIITRDYLLKILKEIDLEGD